MAPTDTQTAVKQIPKKRPRSTGPWKVIVYDDPVNLMTYVTWVFQKIFGYPYSKAYRLMMKVHTEGKAIVAQASKEQAEYFVQCLHAHGLWAGMEGPK